MYFFLTFGFSALVAACTNLFPRRGVIYKLVIFILIAIFSILIAFRLVDHDVGGIDAIAYKMIYEQAKEHSIYESFYMQPWEYGYSLLVWSSSKLGLSFNFFQFIVYSCIFYSLINISNRLIPRGNVFLIMLLFSVGIVDSLNLFRTYIALYLAAWSLVYLTDNKVIFAAFLILISCFIHTSALAFFVILYFSVIYQKNRFYYKLSLALGIVASFIVAQFFIGSVLSGMRVAGYLGTEMEFPIATYLIILAYWLVLNFIVRLGILKNKLTRVLYPSLLSAFIILPVHMVHYMAYRMFFAYVLLLYVLSAVALAELLTSYRKLQPISIFLSLFFLSYPVFRVYGFVSKALSGELSAQLYIFDWDAFVSLVDFL